MDCLGHLNFFWDSALVSGVTQISVFTLRVFSSFVPLLFSPRKVSSDPSGISSFIFTCTQIWWWNDLKQRAIFILGLFALQFSCCGAEQGPSEWQTSAWSTQSENTNKTVRFLLSKVSALGAKAVWNKKLGLGCLGPKDLYIGGISARFSGWATKVEVLEHL